MHSDETRRPGHAPRTTRPHRPQKSPEKRLEECSLSVKGLLDNGRPRDAYRLVQETMAHFPDEPVLLSYYGYLQSLVERKHQAGIDACKRALVLLKKKLKFEDSALSVAYFNLGRTYAVAGRRKEALDAFNRGLAYDSGHQETWSELRRMGMRRKKPPIPFLHRDNPVNKYIGILLYRRYSV